MATLNGVKFRKELLSPSKYEKKAPKAMVAKKITVHETDNMASAINEIRYMIGNNNAVSYHGAVDEKEYVQAVPYNRNTWHAGDGYNGYGNRNTIAIEICKNYDRNRKTHNLVDPLKSDYAKAKANAVKVIAALCVQHGIVANKSNIKQHYDWNGKNCPSKMRKDKAWDAFVNAIVKEYNRLTGKKPASTTSTPKASGSTYTVKKGDTLYSIAKANNVTVKQLKDANKLKSDTIKLGQKLTIPGKSNTSTAKKPATKSEPKKTTAKKKFNLPNATYWVKNPPFSGSGVRIIQEALASIHFYPDKGAKNNGIDGYYGAKTANAVKRFQQVYMSAKEADGDYGPKTKAVMDKIINK